jgi:hypothetical protein
MLRPNFSNQLIRKVQHSLSIFGALLGLVCALLAESAIYTRHQAIALIEDFRSLDKAENPTVVALALMEKYRTHLLEKNCKDDLCQYLYLFDNRNIAKFHFVPRAEVRAYLTLNHQSLLLIYVEYTSAVFKADSPVVGVQEEFCATRTNRPCDYFYLNPHGRNVNQTWNGIVDFGMRATEEQRRAAWTLNPKCFAALHGCRDISELLPAVWKLTSPGTVSSRMRSMADSIADASQPLPD